MSIIKPTVGRVIWYWPSTHDIEAAEAKACTGCGSCAASDPRVRLFLNRGAVIKVNGVPLELEHDTIVLTHAANVPLLSPESVAACKGERAD